MRMYLLTVVLRAVAALGHRDVDVQKQGALRDDDDLREEPEHSYVEMHPPKVNGAWNEIEKIEDGTEGTASAQSPADEAQAKAWGAAWLRDVLNRPDWEQKLKGWDASDLGGFLNSNKAGGEDHDTLDPTEGFKIKAGAKYGRYADYSRQFLQGAAEVYAGWITAWLTETGAGPAGTGAETDATKRAPVRDFAIGEAAKVVNNADVEAARAKAAEGKNEARGAEEAEDWGKDKLADTIADTETDGVKHAVMPILQAAMNAGGKGAIDEAIGVINGLGDEAKKAEALAIAQWFKDTVVD